MREGSPYHVPDMSDEEFAKILDRFRKDIIALANSEPPENWGWRDEAEEFTSLPDKVQEEMRLKIICARAALLACGIEEAENNRRESPAMWLGQVARLLFESEIMSIQDIARKHSEKN